MSNFDPQLLLQYPYNVGVGLSLATVGYWALRVWAAGGKASCADLKKDLKGFNIIITGSNTGIGYQTALQLAKQGAAIYVACRSSEKTTNAVESIKKLSGNDQVYAEDLDLSSLNNVREFAKRWNKTGKPINILINNAGIMALPTKKLSADGYEMQIATNHLGHFLLTELLLERIKEAAKKFGSARIINVSSRGHRLGAIDPNDLNFDTRTYSAFEGQSKLANIVYSKYLAKQVSSFGITVNSLHPGVVRTELTRNNDFLQSLITFLYPVLYSLTKSPWEGAQTTLHLALSDECGKVTGEYFSDCKIDQVSPKNNQVLDDQLQRDFIEVSKKLVGLK